LVGQNTTIVHITNCSRLLGIIHMNRISVIVCSFLMTVTSLYGQKISEEIISKLGIKSVTDTQYRYDEKFGEHIQTFKSKNVYNYNSDGNPMESSRYNSDGTLLRKIFYNTNGDIVERLRYNSNGLITKRTMNQYDSVGKKVNQSEYEKGVLTRKTLYNHNSEGNLTEILDYNPNGLLETRTVYKLNSDGEDIRKTSYYSNGSQDVSTYKYDSQGNKIEWSILPHDDGTFGFTEKRKFDSSGNVTSILKYRSDGVLYSKYGYSYNSSGEILESYFEDYDEYSGPSSTKYDYVYDSNGNLIKKNSYDKDGTLFSTTNLKYNDNECPIEEITYSINPKYGERKTPYSKHTYKYDYY
jgi:hypothetical protein